MKEFRGKSFTYELLKIFGRLMKKKYGNTTIRIWLWHLFPLYL